MTTKHNPCLGQCDDCADCRVSSGPCSEVHGDSVPKLEPHRGSWICTSPNGELREFFSLDNAARALCNGWKVETAAKFVARLTGRAI